MFTDHTEATAAVAQSVGGEGRINILCDEHGLNTDLSVERLVAVVAVVLAVLFRSSI